MDASDDEELNTAGEQAYQLGSFDEAISFFSAAIQQNPVKERYYLNRSLALMQNHSFKKAIADCSNALDVNSNSLEAFVRRSQALTELEKYTEALRDIESVLSISKKAGVMNKKLAQRNRDLVRKLAVRQTQLPQEEFDEYYKTLYRVHLATPLETDMKTNVMYKIHPIITNEFGLFRAKDIKDFYPIKFHLSVVEIDSEGRDGWDDSKYTVEIVDSGKEGEPIENMATLKYEQKECQFNLRIKRKSSSKVDTQELIRDQSANKTVFLKVDVEGDATRRRVVAMLGLLPDTNSGHDQLLTTLSTYRGIAIRDEQIIIREFADAIGTKIWDCGLFLVQYLERRTIEDPSFMANKRVVELGSGTGLVGIACWKLGANSTLTELAEIVPYLDANAKINSGTKDASRLLVRELSWGSPLSDQILPPYDMVVASDVIYELINIDDLIKSISDLCGAHTVVYLAYRCRGLSEEREKAIFESFARVFEYRVAPGSDSLEIYNAKIYEMRKLPTV